MTGEKLYELIGEVNEGYIKAAREPAKKRSWAKWGAMAACLCIAILGAIAYKAEHPYPVREIAANAEVPDGEISGELAVLPDWEDMKLYEQYSEVSLGEITYSVRSAEIPEEQVGDRLGDFTAKGWCEEEEREIKAELFEISGISGKCAVAVRYEGTGEYYAAVNSYYRPETLGQLIDDLSLRENLTFGSIYYEFRKPISGDYATAVFDGADSTKIWDMLLADTSCQNEYDELSPAEYGKVLDISVSVPILGYENISISVREKGYIMTNILDTGKLFCIGEENTEAFISYVLNDCDGYEIVYVNDTTDGIPE